MTPYQQGGHHAAYPFRPTSRPPYVRRGFWLLQHSAGVIQFRALCLLLPDVVEWWFPVGVLVVGKNAQFIHGVGFLRIFYDIQWQLDLLSLNLRKYPLASHKLAIDQKPCAGVSP